MSKKVQNRVESAFALLTGKICLPLSEYTEITRSQAEMERYLARFIDTFTTVLPGAFARRTMVSPLQGSVVDLLVLFNQSHSERFFPTDLLDKLRVTLDAHYDDVLYRARHADIIVSANHFQFRVQPAFLTDEDYYLLPSPNWNDWVKYDALGYKHVFDRTNSQHGSRLEHVIRLVKTWDRLNGCVFNGYYLELLVDEILKNYEIKSYSYALCYVFRSALAEVVYKKDDPANQGIQVEGLLDVDNLIRAMLRFHDAYQVSARALQYEQDGRLDEALSCWAQLFPGAFPSVIDLKIGQIQSGGAQGAEALRLLTDTA